MLLGYKYITSVGPRHQSAACSDGYGTYIVREGDTCWEIAKAHQGTVDELHAANKDIKCDELHVGQELCVPEHK
jgi:LysM repeat protein